jgi:hypothetical protein
MPTTPPLRPRPLEVVQPAGAAAGCRRRSGSDPGAAPPPCAKGHGQRPVPLLCRASIDPLNRKTPALAKHSAREMEISPGRWTGGRPVPALAFAGDVDALAVVEGGEPAAAPRTEHGGGGVKGRPQLGGGGGRGRETGRVPQTERAGSTSPPACVLSTGCVTCVGASRSRAGPLHRGPGGSARRVRVRRPGNMR